MNLAVETSTDRDTDSDTDTGYARPRDPAEIWVARRWQDVLGFCVGIRENFFGVGGNSLDAARVVNFVLDEFDRQLPLNAVTENPTVERLATLVREENGRTLSAPLVEIQGGDGTHPPLFLVHPASGQIGSYCHLARALGDEYPVLGLQPAGLYTDAEPLTTVEAMARAYLDDIRAVDPDGPYFLGGCSTGAAIATELAGLLTTAGAEVRLLATFDEDLLEPAADLVESFHQLAQGRSAAEVLDDWKHRDLVPHDENPDFVTRSLRVWQANNDAARDWRPKTEAVPAHEYADGTHLMTIADDLRRLLG